MSPEDLSALYQFLAILAFLPTFVLALVPMCLPAYATEVNMQVIAFGTSLVLFFHQMANRHDER